MRWNMRGCPIIICQRDTRVGPRTELERRQICDKEDWCDGRQTGAPPDITTTEVIRLQQTDRRRWILNGRVQEMSAASERAPRPDRPPADVLRNCTVVAWSNVGLGATRSALYNTRQITEIITAAKCQENWLLRRPVITVPSIENIVKQAQVWTGCSMHVPRINLYFFCLLHISYCSIQGHIQYFHLGGGLGGDVGKKALDSALSTKSTRWYVTGSINDLEFSPFQPSFIPNLIPFQPHPKTDLFNMLLRAHSSKHIAFEGLHFIYT